LKPDKESRRISDQQRFYQLITGAYGA